MSFTPYDPSTLSQRIQSQLAGISELSAYFASTSGSAETPVAVPASDNRVEAKKLRLDEMIRIHLGDEWWADMRDEEARVFLEKKRMGSSCSSLE